MGTLAITALWTALWVVCIAGGIVLAAVIFNLAVDPWELYHGSRLSGRLPNTRKRKLDMLDRIPAGTTLGTLVIGTSRLYNLDLAAQTDINKPVFNFSVTNSRAEDYLALYVLAKEKLGRAPKTLVVGFSPPAMHPRLKVDWEARVTKQYTPFLVKLGVLNHDPGWRWRLLFTPQQVRRSYAALQRTGRQMNSGIKQKFQWHDDGHLAWLVPQNAERRQRLIRRQLRNYPYTGIAISSFDRLGEKRKEFVEELLRQAQADGCRIFAYMVPEHPELYRHIEELGGGHLYGLVADHLAEVVPQFGGEFHDWHTGEELGLSESHFRDTMHLTDDGQRIIAARINELIAKQ